MVLPLGLGTRLFKFPIMVLVIAIICGVWSHAHFKQMNFAEAQIKDLLNKSRLKDLGLRVAMAACQNRGYQSCDRWIQKNKPSTAQRDVANTAPHSDDKIKTQPSKRTPLKFDDVWTEAKGTINLQREFQKDHKMWAPDIQSLPEYTAYLNELSSFNENKFEIYREQGLFSAQSFSIENMFRASFTHAGYGHLISNLLILILVGIWVEQLIGSISTFIVFLIGSGLGLTAQIVFTKETMVIGASAGIFALLGVFFVFFYQKQIRFLFIILPYVRILTLPAMWIFPIFYFVGDLVTVSGGTQSHIASFAHLGGLGFGLLSGAFIRMAYGLGPDEVYVEEQPVILRLQKVTSDQEIWTAFETIAKMNSQNWFALKTFLTRTAKGEVTVTDSDRVKFLTEQIRFACIHFLKKGEINTMIDFLTLIPKEINFAECLRDRPASQILYLADLLANKKYYSLALRLYNAALAIPSAKLKQASIQSAIHRINQNLSQIPERIES